MTNTQTNTNNSTSQPQNFSIGKRMLAGATIGLFLISLFLFSAPDADPAWGWGKFWMIRPLILVPLAGAMGGLCNHFILHFRGQVGINKTTAIILSVLVFIIGLWLGTVLGLDGTWWD
jgi:hypothetical protein